MNQEQLDVLNITQEVLRPMVLAMGLMNPRALPGVALALQAAAADSRTSPIASQVLAELARSIDAFVGSKPGGGH